MPPLFADDNSSYRRAMRKAEKDARAREQRRSEILETLRRLRDKSGDPADLVEAIRKVADGGQYLPAAIAQRIAFGRLEPTENPLTKLSAREVEILRLLGSGKTLSEVAWHIHVSYKTVANSSSIIRQKLGIRSLSEVVRFAIDNGLA